MIRIELGAERFGSESGQQRVMRRTRRPQHCAEAPRVVIAEHDTVAEFEVDMVVDAFGRGVPVNAQTAGHAKMDEQRIRPQPE